MNWSMIILIVMMVAYVGFFIYSGKKRQDEFVKFQNSLTIGQRAILSDGIHGTIVKLSDQTCDVEISDGVVITVNRNAISGLEHAKQPEQPAAPQAENVTEAPQADAIAQEQKQKAEAEPAPAAVKKPHAKKAAKKN